MSKCNLCPDAIWTRDLEHGDGGAWIEGCDQGFAGPDEDCDWEPEEEE